MSTWNEMDNSEDKVDVDVVDTKPSNLEMEPLEMGDLRGIREDKEMEEPKNVLPMPFEKNRKELSFPGISRRLDEDKDDDDKKDKSTTKIKK